MPLVRLLALIFQTLDEQLPVEDRVALFSGWARLTRAGISPVDALEQLGQQRKALAPLAKALAEGQGRGETLSDSLKPVAKLLGPMPLALLRASENSGRLDASLSQLHRLAVSEKANRELALRALSRPASLLGVVLYLPPVVVFALSEDLLYVLYDAARTAPVLGWLIGLVPVVAPTWELYLALSVGVSGVLFAAAIGLGLLYQLVAAALPGLVDGLTSLMPYLGTWRRGQRQALTFQALAASLRTGLSLYEVAELAPEFLGPARGGRLKERLLRCLEESEGIGQALAAEGLLGDEDLLIVESAEETGTLDEAFEELAQQRRKQVEYVLERGARVLTGVTLTTAFSYFLLLLFLFLSVMLQDSFQGF